MSQIFKPCPRCGELDCKNIYHPLAADPGCDARRVVMAEVSAERDRQDVLHGEHSIVCVKDPLRAVAILVEEVGEVSRAALEGDGWLYREELLQVAAVAVAMVEAYDASRGVV